VFEYKTIVSNKRLYSSLILVLLVIVYIQLMLLSFVCHVHVHIHKVFAKFVIGNCFLLLQAVNSTTYI